MDTIDPQVKNLVMAIGKAETGGASDPYNTKGPSGEYGRYQFMPNSWKMWAKESLGNENAPMSVENQNKVAYNKVKQWKDQGLNPAQIASKWNSGDENAYQTQTPGKNSHGVYYDTPGYTKKVSNYYHELSGGATNTSDGSVTPTAEVATTTPPIPQHKKDALEKIGDLVNAVFPGKEVGESIGTLAAYLATPKDKRQYFDLSAPTPLQTAADIGQGALMVGGIPALGAASGTAARLGTAAAEAGAYGGLNSVAGGETNVGKVAENAAIGAGVGLATGGLIEGGGAAFKGLKNLINGKTAEEILATAPEDVSKLSAKQQKLWYQTQSKNSIEHAIQTSQAAKQASQQATEDLNKEITNFQQKIGSASREEAINLKQPAQKVMKDMSNEYVELTGEAADGSSALTKTSAKEDLSSKIDSKFEYDPQVGASLKNDLGIVAPEVPKTEGLTGTPGVMGTPKVEKITNQEILDKAREIMQSVSKSARQGNKVYSPAEHEAMKKYSFLMEYLGENGVDMKAANKFWKEWAPLRDRIVREIKPFEETNVGKMPFSSTVTKASSVAKTATQAASKLDAQNFIGELESRMKLPKGTIGTDVRKQVEGLEKAKLSKENIKKITEETLAKIKAGKAEALKTMTLKKYNDKKAADIRRIIKIVVGSALGLETLKRIPAVGHLIGAAASSL